MSMWNEGTRKYKGFEITKYYESHGPFSTFAGVEGFTWSIHEEYEHLGFSFETGKNELSIATRIHTFHTLKAAKEWINNKVS